MTFCQFYSRPIVEVNIRFVSYIRAALQAAAPGFKFKGENLIEKSHCETGFETCLNSAE